MNLDRLEEIANNATPADCADCVHIANRTCQCNDPAVLINSSTLLALVRRVRSAEAREAAS